MRNHKLQKLNDRILEKFKEKELVLGDGKEGNQIMLIGEAPGAKEIELKLPFVGKAGKYLEEFLNILNISRENIYLTNTVKYRPTKLSAKTGKSVNRPPSNEEIDMFKEFLYEEIEIIAPNIIVTLGNVPLKTVLGTKDAKIGDLHGKLTRTIISNKGYDVFPLYHPAAVIYNRSLKEVYYKDLEELRRHLSIRI